MNNKYNFWGVMILVVSLLASSCGGGKPNHKASLKTDADSAFYYLGIYYGAQFAAWGFEEIKYKAFAKGLEESLNGNTQDDEEKWMELNMFLADYLPKLQAAKVEKEAEETLKQGQAFLESNKRKSGVVTLPSGLQYKIVREGTGAKPTRDDLVELVYHGTLIDGTIFDSAREREDTVTFDVNRLVSGFSEALTMMSEGSIWEVYIPAELGYGMNTPDPDRIKPNSVLIFEIDLVNIVKFDMPE